MGSLTRFPVAVVTLVTLCAQTPAFESLDRLRQELHHAIHDGDLVKAADLASRLDEGVQRQYRASLNRDSDQRIRDVSNWLPGDTEALLVLQEPTILEAVALRDGLMGGPARRYAFDRLMALNEGAVWQKLNGKTVRMVVAGIRNMRSRMGDRLIIPAFMPHADSTYAYLLTEPLLPDVFGPPESMSGNVPVWRATARIDAGELPKRGGGERVQREDLNWLALARPDTLILCSKHEALAAVLQRISLSAANQGDRPDRALPERLRIWSQVNRKAQFWGVRWYSEPGERIDLSNARGRRVDGIGGDSSALGIAVQYDLESGDLKIRYLGGDDKPPYLNGRVGVQQFHATPIAGGGWQFTANTVDRGDFPFHVAAFLLGFGGYR
jgi:hypothetical protein